jgi:outer membrane lipoprotein SlyB
VGPKYRKGYTIKNWRFLLSPAHTQRTPVGSVVGAAVGAFVSAVFDRVLMGAMSGAVVGYIVQLILKRDYSRRRSGHSR